MSATDSSGAHVGRGDGAASGWEEVLESLPRELQRHLLDIRDLDQRTEMLSTSLNDRINSIVTHAADLEDHGTLSVRQISDDFSKAIDMTEQKVQLAMRAYEMVDQHKKRLDAEISRYETTLATKVDHDGLKASKRKHLTLGKVAKDSKRSRRGRKSKQEVVEEEEQLDGDGNEPTYCICKRVSFGLMTACDNPTCPVEWYHNICVGLKDPPKGKWFCPLCAKK